MARKANPTKQSHASHSQAFKDEVLALTVRSGFSKVTE